MKTSPTQHRRRSAAQWQALIERQQSSGQGQAAFCAAEGLAVSTFGLWKQRLAKAGKPAAVRNEDPDPPVFAELTVRSAPETQPAREPAPSWDIELDLGEGLCLRIRRGQPC